MEIQNIKLIKDWCTALCYVEEQDCYAIIIGKTGNIKLTFTEDTNDILYHSIVISQFVQQRNASINIPFIQHNDSIFHIITLHNKEEYNTILQILEVIL